MRSRQGESGAWRDGKRVGPRRSMIQEVSLFDETGQPIVLETIDVGPQGLFVRSDVLLDLGDEMWVSLKLPEGPKLVVRGRVVRGQLGGGGQPSGMGIAFVDITAREESWLRRYIREDSEHESVWQVINDDAARSGSSPWDCP